ncbi:MAG: hypothetical protein KKG60_00060 [Nanoarchaeota archaeon]|nr:hypothetical protein [Nanoarchaeota archaeon]
MKEQDFNIKEEYEKLKKKYPELPAYEKLNKEFELYSIKDKDYLIFSINKRISEYVSFFCRMIESILFPNAGNLIGAYESKSFNDSEKQKIGDIHKELMFIERELMIIHLKKDEKAAVAYILSLTKRWEKIKKDIIWISEKMKEAWEIEDKEHKNNYFG